MTEQEAREVLKRPDVIDNGVDRILDVEFSEPKVTSGNNIKLEFDFEGVPVTMMSGEGSFRFHEQLPPIVRGMLSLAPERGPVEFELDIIVYWISDADFQDKIREATKFNLTVTLDDQQYTLKDADLTEMSWDMAGSAFSLCGVVDDVGT